MDAINAKIYATLKAIKENDGFPGPVPAVVRANILGRWATVEVSPLTGLDVQWTLTADGKKKLSEYGRSERFSKRYREKLARGHGRPSHHVKEVPVPLTIEVLDALKAIREFGEPNTDKMDILARIQRHGIHGAKNVKGTDGRETLVYGALAIFEDGVWSLTDAGRRVEAGHIRKSECAQFSGKVR